MAPTVHASATLGHAHFPPVGGAVTDAAVAGRVHQGFQQHGLHPVVRQPVGRQLVRGARQDMTGEVGNLGPGENQKAAVIDHQRKIAWAHRIGPADPGIARSHAPGGAGEQQSGQRRQFRLRGPHPVAQLGPEGRAVTEVVIAVEILPKEASLVRILDQLQLNGPVAIERAREQVVGGGRICGEFRQRCTV